MADTTGSSGRRKRSTDTVTYVIEIAGDVGEEDDDLNYETIGQDIYNEVS